MYDPDQLRTFLAVAQSLSFTQAAERLGIRQPTVSQHVRKLDDDPAQTEPAPLGGVIAANLSRSQLERCSERSRPCRHHHGACRRFSIPTPLRIEPLPLLLCVVIFTVKLKFDKGQMR